MIDCDYDTNCGTSDRTGNCACDGGDPGSALNFIVSTNGVPTRSAYPYTGSKGNCVMTNSRTQVHTGKKWISANSPSALKGAVYDRPVVVALQSDKSVFEFYSSGILDSSACGTSLNHGVTVVGWGYDSGKDYFKIKNSWGTSWGESGYARLNNDGVEGSAG